jgi:hypothetical protein
MNTDVIEGLHRVKAMLNYLADQTENPVAYMHTPPPGIPERTGRYTKHTVPIHDGRVIFQKISLDQHGFLLTSHVGLLCARDRYYTLSHL